MRLVGLQKFSKFCPGFLTSLGALLSEPGAPHRARLVGLQSLAKITPGYVGAFGVFYMMLNLSFRDSDVAARRARLYYELCWLVLHALV